MLRVLSVIAPGALLQVIWPKRWNDGGNVLVKYEYANTPATMDFTTPGDADPTIIGLTLNGSTVSYDTEFYTGPIFEFRAIDSNNVNTNMGSIIFEQNLTTDNITENTNEDTTLTIDLTDKLVSAWNVIKIKNASDTDILTNASLNTPVNISNGSIQFTTATSLTYTPDLNWYGTEETLTIYGSLNTGQSGQERNLTINVGSIDDKPVIAPIVINYQNIPPVAGITYESGLGIYGTYTVNLLDFTTDIDDNDLTNPAIIYSIIASEVPSGVDITDQTFTLDSDDITQPLIFTFKGQNEGTQSDDSTITFTGFIKNIDKTFPANSTTGIIDLSNEIYPGWNTIHIKDANGTEILTNTTLNVPINISTGTLEFTSASQVTYTGSYLGSDTLSYTYYGSNSTDGTITSTGPVANLVINASIDMINSKIGQDIDGEAAADLFWSFNIIK